MLRLEAHFLSNIMPLPYKVSTLLYCFNQKDEVLLLQRAQEPNRGLWSPCGGKLDMAAGESPFACACREAAEEIGLSLRPVELHLTGWSANTPTRDRPTGSCSCLKSGPACGNCRRRIAKAGSPFSPPPKSLVAPSADRCRANLAAFLAASRRFFSAHCRGQPDGRNEWTLEESIPK